MHESAYTQSINRLLPPGVYHIKLNCPYTKGLPDTWYSGKRGDIWIEWKLVRKTPKRQLTIGLSPLQTKWLNDRFAEGRNVAVLVGTPAGVLVVQDGKWNEPITHFNHLTKRDAAEWITQQVLPRGS